MDWTIEHRGFGAHVMHDAPPRWAVVAVKVCVVGLLLLPLATLVWALAYTPSEGADLGPIAFLISIGLGLALFSCATALTTAYPPVRRPRHR